MRTRMVHPRARLTLDPSRYTPSVRSLNSIAMITMITLPSWGEVVNAQVL